MTNPSRRAQVHRLVDAWASDAITKGTRYLQSSSLLALETAIEAALDACVEAETARIATLTNDGADAF